MKSLQCVCVHNFMISFVHPWGFGWDWVGPLPLSCNMFFSVVSEVKFTSMYAVLVSSLLVWCVGTPWYGMLKRMGDRTGLDMGTGSFCWVFRMVFSSFSMMPVVW